MIDGGASVLMISHQLEEVVEVTDRVTVLRDGQVVEIGIPTKEIDEAGLTRLMLGRHLVTHNRVDSHATAETAVQVRNLVVRSVRGLDLDLKKGEIVGLTGLVGSGAVAVAEAIGGAREAQGGHADRQRQEAQPEAEARLDRGVHPRGRRVRRRAPPGAGPRRRAVGDAEPDAAPGAQPRRPAADRRRRGRPRRRPP